MQLCVDCRATFALLERSENFQRRAMLLDETHPDCCCQALSVSEHSTGRIDGNEILVRILVAPQHMDKRGEPKAGALTDAERSGLSLFREGQATDTEIRKVAEVLVERARGANGRKPEKAGVFGALRMRCNVIRCLKIELESTPSYCVYDTALKETPSHAETFQRVAGVPPELCEERRRALFNLVKADFVPVALFRAGLLLDLAPKA
jgi:hypothetical protein